MCGIVSMARPTRNSVPIRATGPLGRPHDGGREPCAAVLGRDDDQAAVHHQRVGQPLPRPHADKLIGAFEHTGEYVLAHVVVEARWRRGRLRAVMDSQGTWEANP
jgi:hypothetical protein